MAESVWWRDSRLLLWWSGRAQSDSTAYHNDLYAKDLSKDVHVNEGTARRHTGNPQPGEVGNRYHHCARSHYYSQWILMAPRAVLVMGRWTAFAKTVWALLFEWPLTTRVEKKALREFLVVYLPFRDGRYNHDRIPSGKWQNNIVLAYSKQHLPGLATEMTKVYVLAEKRNAGLRSRWWTSSRNFEQFQLTARSAIGNRKESSDSILQSLEDENHLKSMTNNHALLGTTWQSLPHQTASSSVLPYKLRLRIEMLSLGWVRETATKRAPSLIYWVVRRLQQQSLNRLFNLVKVMTQSHQ